MPVYLFTFHAYRTWNADDPRGYVRKHADVRPSDPQLAQHYERAATQPTAHFTDQVQRALLRFIHDACARRDWQLYGVAAEPTHVHLLIGWFDETISFDHVRHRLKNLASGWLNRRFETRRWFSRGSSRKRVLQQTHFDHLLTNYLPKHRGLVWIRGRDTPPPAPDEPGAPSHGSE